MLEKPVIGIWCLLCTLMTIEGKSQSLTVSGKVLYNPTMSDCFQQTPCLNDISLTKDDQWIPPKAAVNIRSKVTGKVAKTDHSGNYSIEVSSANDTLTFLYIGHNRVEIPVNGREIIDIKLTPTPIPVIEQLLAQIMPLVDAGTYPDINKLAKDAKVNRATARDILWLVLGNTRMRQYYPTEFIPDYRFETD